MKPGEKRFVRHATLAAQGVFNDIKHDHRFKVFKWYNGAYRHPGQVDDLRVFTICRKPAAPK